MDFTLLGALVTALLGVLPVITAYFRRTSRATRAENRRLRRLVQAHDVHLYRLERLGWTSRGVDPPARPELLRGDDDDQGPDGAGPDDGQARSGPRHTR